MNQHPECSWIILRLTQEGPSYGRAVQYNERKPAVTLYGKVSAMYRSKV